MTLVFNAMVANHWPNDPLPRSNFAQPGTTPTSCCPQAWPPRWGWPSSTSSPLWSSPWSSSSAWGLFFPPCASSPWRRLAGDDGDNGGDGGSDYGEVIKVMRLWQWWWWCLQGSYLRADNDQHLGPSWSSWKSRSSAWFYSLLLGRQLQLRGRGSFFLQHFFSTIIFQIWLYFNFYSRLQAGEEFTLWQNLLLGEASFKWTYFHLCIRTTILSKSITQIMIKGKFRILTFSIVFYEHVQFQLFYSQLHLMHVATT